MVLADRIEHTLLRPTATGPEIDALCDEAAAHGFHAVCVAGTWVSRAARRLDGSGVNVCSTVGFPLGSEPTQVKVFEARTAVQSGAHEVDMVWALGSFLGGDPRAAALDVQAVVDAASVPVKVIVETGFLTAEQIAMACAIVHGAGAAFIKTSTGFGPRGATVEDVREMRRALADAAVQIKAAGGIRTRRDAEALIAAGADRLGTSAGVALVTGDAR